MKIKFEVIPVEKLQAGDIFYCTPCYELNEFGEDWALTGTDQIFIMDDYYDEDEDDNYAVLVNGGWHVWFRPDEKVVRLGRYSELVRIIGMVEEGNPDMNLGPNDILTEIDYIQEHLPETRIDLLANLNLNDDIDEDNDDKPLENDDELPF